MRDAKEMCHLAVVGAGYVGLRLALAAARAGWSVSIYDVDPSLVNEMLAGRSTMDGIDDHAFAQAVASRVVRPRLVAGGIAPFDVAVIVVPTPAPAGRPDPSHVAAAAEAVGASLRSGNTVVLESTSYPGTTEELVLPMLEKQSGLAAGLEFFLGFSPERIDPGSGRWSLENTPKLVAGLTAECARRVEEFYSGFVASVVRVPTVREAELAKLLENTFRFVNVSLVNEFAAVAHELGINFSNVVEAASTKPFGFMRFDPGPGVGGHCIPVDPLFLQWLSRDRLGHDMQMISSAAAVNEAMPRIVVNRVRRAIGTPDGRLDGRTVMLVGIAFKRNVADTRGSVAYPIAALLQALGAEVRCADPLVAAPLMPQGCAIVPATVEAASACDGLIILADHDRIALDALAHAALWALDCRQSTSGGVERL